jgi:hypothetical protein
MMVFGSPWILYEIKTTWKTFGRVVMPLGRPGRRE